MFVYDRMKDGDLQERVETAHGTAAYNDMESKVAERERSGDRDGWYRHGEYQQRYQQSGLPEDEVAKAPVDHRDRRDNETRDGTAGADELTDDERPQRTGDGSNRAADQR